MIKIFLQLTLISILLSCAKAHRIPAQAESMQASTAEIHDNVPAENRAISEELKFLLRAGIGNEYREEAWAKMIDAKEMADKLFQAGNYFSGFDFQAWNYGFKDSSILNNVTFKQTAYKNAIRELTIRISDMNPGKLSTKDQDLGFDVFTDDNDLKSILALSVTMDWALAMQGDKVPSEKKESLSTYIEKALALPKPITISELNQVEREILKNELLYRLLVISRFQYNAYIASIWSTTPGREMHALNAIESSIKNRQFLKSIGLDIKLQKKLKAKLKKIKVDDSEFNSKLELLLSE